MNAQSILEFLKHHRIAVEEHGGELSLQAPKGVLDAQMIAALKANKVQIIAAIRIVSLEQQLEAARRRIAYLESRPPYGALP